VSWVFWCAAAALLGLALLFVLPPLLRPRAAPAGGVASPMDAYREQRAQLDADLAQGAIAPAQHAQALAELQARVVEEVGELDQPAAARHAPPAASLVVTVALLIPAGALAIYGVLGAPAALQGEAAQAPHALDEQKIEAMVEKLAGRLRANPDDAAGWMMLARSYSALERLPEAAEAYGKANALAPGDPQLLADYADVLAMVNGRNLQGRPMALVMEALRVDPGHPKALALAGTDAFHRGDFPQAAAWWRKLLAVLPPDSEQARVVQANIAQAEAGGAPPVAGAARPAAQPPRPGPAAAGATVEGTVQLSDAVKSQVPPGAMLFVYARPTDGSRMPVAVLRQPADRFPFAFRLDDSMAMAPEARLSLHAQVQLVARISKSGDAAPRPGDITGSAGPVQVGSRGVRQTLDQVVK
jgi:cytochrome c-type biogenesis protein CcmH